LNDLQGINIKEKGLIIDSHLSHLFFPEKIDFCIVIKTKLKELEKRLKKRNYNEQKVRENLDSEIFNVCFNEAVENGLKVVVLGN
jgi:adenylate kinase